MLKNYLRIAIRNLLKYRIFSLFNIIGLATGITACLFITLYVKYQKSYDTFYEDSNQIYRVRWERHSQKGDEIKFASACPAVGYTLQENFPEIENYACCYKAQGVFSYREQIFKEEHVFWAQNSYLNLFSFEFVQGDSKEALSKVNTVVISEDIAKKYFRNENPIGKMLTYDKGYQFEVKAVFKNRPENVHCKTDILISYPTLEKAYGDRVMTSWLYSGFYTYVKLKASANPKDIEAKIPQLLKDKIGDLLKKYQLKMFFYLQPVQDIHLNSHYMHELDRNGDRKTVTFLYIIAYFIIFIAWINFLNLSTITYIGRAKEVGLRKTIGASRKQIVLQFLLEAVIVNLTAIILSILLLFVFMPAFQNLTDIPNSYQIWNQQWLYTNLAWMSLVGIFLSGMYPVWGLSFSNINKMLKGDFKGSKSGLTLRKGLVLLQFTVSFLLIAGTLSVSKQLDFMKAKDSGFDKENVLVVNIPVIGDSTLVARRETFKRELCRDSKIEKVAYSAIVPGKTIHSNLGTVYREGDEPTSSKNYRLDGVDYDFLDLYHMKFIKGKNFSKDRNANARSIIINEKAALFLGYQNPEDAVGTRVYVGRSLLNVIGVIKNYAHLSPKEDFEPMILHAHPRQGYISIKLNEEINADLVQKIKTKYSEIFSGNPFDYYSLEESYSTQFKEDERFGTVFGIFSILGIIITALGLLSLSAFTAKQRKKEIGVRKVLGASIQSILLMLSREYIKLLAIASVVMIPLFYYCIDLWLQAFAYRMEISVFLFIVPIVLVALIAVFTISFQSYKTANLNPVDSIKYE